MLFSENFQVFYTSFFWASAIGFSFLFFIYCKFREKGKIWSTLRILLSFILAAIFFFLPPYLAIVLGTSGPMIVPGQYSVTTPPPNSFVLEGLIIYLVVLSSFAVYILLFLRKARLQKEEKI